MTRGLWKQAKAELESLRARNAALGKQADEASGWLDDLRESRRQLRNIETQLLTLRSQHSSLQDEHSGLKLESDRLRHELERTSNSLDQAVGHSEGQVQVIRSLRERGTASRQPRRYLTSRIVKGLRSTLKLKLVSDVRRSRHIRNRIDLLSKSGLFDPDWYIKRYPDVIGSHIEPATHFVLHGSAGGSRSWSCILFLLFYLSTYPDVSDSGEEPVYHFIFHGRSEGRSVLPAE